MICPAVSVRRTHLELISDVSQDRVHVNNRAHHAQRLRDFNTFKPTHPPDLYAAIQSRTGGCVPATWHLYRGIGGTTWHERQRTAPLAQGTSAQRMSRVGCTPSTRHCIAFSSIHATCVACANCYIQGARDQGGASQGHTIDGSYLAPERDGRPC